MRHFTSCSRLVHDVNLSLLTSNNCHTCSNFGQPNTGCYKLFSPILLLSLRPWHWKFSTLLYTFYSQTSWIRYSVPISTFEVAHFWLFFFKYWVNLLIRCQFKFNNLPKKIYFYILFDFPSQTDFEQIKNFDYGAKIGIGSKL